MSPPDDELQAMRARLYILFERVFDKHLFADALAVLSIYEALHGDDLLPEGQAHVQELIRLLDQAHRASP